MLYPIKSHNTEELHETESFLDSMLCGDADKKMLSMSMRCDGLQRENWSATSKVMDSYFIRCYSKKM